MSVAARVAGLPWALVAAGRATAYRRGWLPTQELDAPTISVGSLEMGGTGKTPAVATVVRCLRAAGHRPAVLSRGHGRRSRGPTLVADDGGVRATVTESGDEPALLARELPGVPVAVAARREEAAALLDREAVDVFVLDDGYQHVRVRRHVDLLVVDSARPFWLGSTPPLGRLREPGTAAGRATAVLLVGEGEGARAEIERRLPARPVFGLRAEVGTPRPWSDPSIGSDGPLLAFAAIARPARFFAAARAAGLTLAGTRTFRDHHWFDEADLAAIECQAERTGARALLTTTKDAVRFEALERIPALPLLALPYDLVAETPEALEDWLDARVREANG